MEMDKIELLQNIDEVFNSLLFANLKEGINENYILILAENALIYFSESLFNDGLTVFMKTKHLLCRNFYLNYKMFFWYFDTNSKYEFMDDFKFSLGGSMKKLLDFTNLLERAKE